MKASAHIYHRKPGDSYLLIIYAGYESSMGGIPAVRYFSLRNNIEEVVEADKAIREYKDIYKKHLKALITSSSSEFTKQESLT